MCVCCVCANLLFFVWLFLVLGDALLCCEVVCRCEMGNSVLTTCEVYNNNNNNSYYYYNIGVMRLVCWVVGLVLFVSIGVLLYFNFYIVVMILFGDVGFFCCVWAGVADLGGGLCMLRL